MTRLATEYGAYEITPLPGQPQVAVCHGFMVPQSLRGMGYGYRLKQHQNDAIAAQLHDFAICTVASGNVAQKRVLGAAGWVKLAEFKNTRSSETTELWGHEVNGVGDFRESAQARNINPVSKEVARLAKRDSVINIKP